LALGPISAARCDSAALLVVPLPATTDIYTLSLHDALPILWMHLAAEHRKQEENLDKAGRAPEEQAFPPPRRGRHRTPHRRYGWRSEEHTSELQSRFDLVCRLLLEKKEDTATRKRPRVY